MFKVMVTVILSEKGLLNLPPKTKKGRNQRKENLKLPQCQMTLKRNLILRYKYLSNFVLFTMYNMNIAAQPYGHKVIKLKAALHEPPPF